MQSVCYSGKAQIGLILVVKFIDWSSCLPVNSIDKTEVFALALVSCSVFWLSCIQLANLSQDENLFFFIILLFLAL